MQLYNIHLSCPMICPLMTQLLWMIVQVDCLLVVTEMDLILNGSLKNFEFYQLLWIIKIGCYVMYP